MAKDEFRNLNKSAIDDVKFLKRSGNAIVGAEPLVSPSVDNRLVRVNSTVGGIQQAIGVLLDDNDYLYDLARIGVGPGASPPSHPIHYQNDTLAGPAGRRDLIRTRGILTSGGVVTDLNSAATAHMFVEQTGGTHGSLYGIDAFAYLVDGIIGSGAADKFVVASSGFAEIDAGQIFGDIAGIGNGLIATWSGIGAYGGTIDDAAVIYAYGEVDGATVNGNAYMLYLDEINSMDECIRQVGTSPNTLGGALEVVGITTASGGISRGTPTELTIAADAITVTKGYHTIDGQTDLDDDLSTINGGVDGETLIIRPVSSARTITVKDGIGNIECEGDFAMDNEEDTMMLIYDATLVKWLEVSRANNGA